MAEMAEADFSGYATRNGIKCSDGRTIVAGAFSKQDKTKIPLVWSHQHNDPALVLGHVMLEDRADGVYAYGFLNDTESGQNTKTLIKHGDIEALSIYANKLVEKNKNVVHGSLVEVSIVMNGANPGAFIDTISLAHGDGSSEDEALIYTDIEDQEFTISHSDEDDEDADEDSDDTDDQENEELSHAEILETLNEEQSEAVYGLVEAALAHTGEKDTEELIAHADSNTDKGATVADGEKTVEDIVNTMNEEQTNVLKFLVGEALSGGSGDAEHSDNTDAITGAESDTNDETVTHSDTNSEGALMGNHNVFDKTEDKDVKKGATLSHSQMETIFKDAKEKGSLKESFLSHAGDYGIDNIDILFPDAQSVSTSPEVIGRRTEWVASVLGGTKHSPFSRIKSTAVDITADEARAKGYVKGNLKKNEVIALLKRVTTPTTIYKKQKLDRDDIIDITDIDVVLWLKAEMRLMLDEELARAILIGDGREPDDEDKIDETHIRPIAYDDDMYAHQVTVPANVSSNAIIESVLRARTYYKGTGVPTLYTTDAILTDLILIKDTLGRRLYNSEQELAAAMRVSSIVTVEVLEDAPDLIAIIVSIGDYTIGADAGGAVNLFDDFDIDYNQYKYLIETRVSGALTKPKSAVVIKRTPGNLTTPVAPSYNATTHTITFPTTAGVNYQVNGVTKTGTLTITSSTTVEAVPADGYSFAHNTDTDWDYIYTA